MALAGGGFLGNLELSLSANMEGGKVLQQIQEAGSNIPGSGSLHNTVLTAQRIRASFI